MQDEHNADNMKAAKNILNSAPAQRTRMSVKVLHCATMYSSPECTAQSTTVVQYRTVQYSTVQYTIHSMRLSVKIESAIPAVLDCEKLSNHCGSDIRSPQNK